MLRDFLDRLIQLGHDRVQITTVDDSPDARVKQVLVDGVKRGDRYIEHRLPPKKTHSFDTLVGLTSYLNSDHCTFAQGDKDIRGQKHIVFVGGEFVTANLSYSSNCVQAAYLNLDLAEEFLALLKLGNGVGQKTLWRLLVTHLSGCFSDALLLAISDLSLTATEESAATIEELGGGEESSSRRAEITFPSRKTGDTETKKTIEVDWVYTGRYRECFQQQIVVRVRLEIAIENGSPRFYFHPMGLPTIMREYREALADHLRNELKAERYTIHEGTEVPDPDSQSEPPLGQDKGFTY